METTEIEILPLEKVIETKLVKANVTEQVLAALKEKYGGLRLTGLDNKESYLELKAAAKDCAKVRTLTVKLCKEGREDALKIQKLWISKEKEIVGKVAEVEDVLDSEIKKYDDEQQRKIDEERKRQEDNVVQRQATLTRLGATYDGSSWNLGETSYESDLIKKSSEDVWEEAILPKFQSEFQKIEAVRIEEETKKQEAAAELKRQQETFAKEQEEFRLQQAEMKRKQEEALRLEREKQQAEENRIQKERNDLHQKRWQIIAPFQPAMTSELWRETEEEFVKSVQLAKETFDIREQEKNKRIEERAAQQERERISEEQRVTEQKRLQEEAKRQEELAKSNDRVKWNDFLNKFQKIEVPETKSGQYRKKAQIAKEKIEEILSL